MSSRPTFIKQLTLHNFRNYESETALLNPGINLICGKNGAGKTNLLEALYLLSTGRSFRKAHLSNLIRRDCSYFYIEICFLRNGIEQTLSIGFDGKNRKILYNGEALNHFSNLLGILPSVLHAPTDNQLIAGVPFERRRFLDIQLAQSDPLYVYHLVRYQRAMKHRNALLKLKNEKSLASWEEVMATSASYLMKKRAALIEGLRPKMQTFSQKLSEKKDVFDLFYIPSISMKYVDRLSEIFYKQRKKELFLGTTLSGPHRDDFLITYQDQEAKIYASEGQKRTCTAALKMAEREWLSREEALLGIDDFGAHLDERRIDLFYEVVSSIGQVFLTAPSDTLMNGFLDKRRLFIENGSISQS